MTGIRIFSVHYLWEDCVSMVLGVLIALTSWMVGDAGSQAVADPRAGAWGVRVLGFAPLGRGTGNRVRFVADRVTVYFWLR